MIHQFLVVSLFLFSAVMLLSDELKPIRQWKGLHPDLALKDLCPENSLITDSEQLKKIWQLWRPDEDVPKIDFQSDGILVATVRGPNQMLINGLKVENGDLQFTTGSTRMAGPGFGYLLIQIPRTGIKSVIGIPVEPATTGNQTTKDSIEVVVVGKIQTGVMAIGGESTGTTITANNITWELDLQNDEQLLEAVNTIGQTFAQVKGRLTKKAGVEIRERWIVLVDSIVVVAGAAPDNGSWSIEIVTSGGFAGVSETKTIRSTGSVENEKKRQRISESWNLPPEKLHQLNRLIAETDWSSIPADTRERMWWMHFNIRSRSKLRRARHIGFPLTNLRSKIIGRSKPCSS